MYLCGVFLNRGRLIIFLLTCCIGVLLYHTEALLLGLGQNEQVSYLTGQYCRYMIPAQFLVGLTDANKVYLNSMNFTTCPVLIQCSAIPLHIFFSYYFVNYYARSFYGLCYAVTLTDLLIFIAMTIYSSCLKDIREAWFLPNMDSLRGWGQYLGLGLPGCLMVFLEFLVYEGLVILAGLIGVEEMSALSLILNLGTFLFAIPFSLSLVICIYVGNALGDNNA